MIRHGIIPSRTEVERIEINQKRIIFFSFLFNLIYAGIRAKN